MTRVRSCLVAGAALLALSGPLIAAEEKKDPSEVSYYRDVRRLFQQHCQGCHQPAKPMGGFVMTSYADLLKKGDHDRPGLIPGQPDKSLVVEMIAPRGGKKPEMPKGKDPLSARDVELIRKWIAQGAKDDTPMNVRAVVDADHPPVYEQPPDLTSLDYSPDGKLVAVSGYHEVLLHRADGSGLVARLVGLSERIESVAFSPDAKWLAVAGGSPGRFGEVQVWDVAKRKLKVSASFTFDTLYGVSWSPDGTKVAFGCADNTVRAVEALTGKQVLFQGAHSDWVLDTVFSGDSGYLVSVSRDGSMKLTRVPTQRFIDNITSITPGALKGGLQSVDRNPKKTGKKEKGEDGEMRPYEELLIGGSDGQPRLYKMHRTKKRVIGDDFNKLREYEPMEGRVFAVRFSPDGNRFAAGSSLDGRGEVRVYQVADGKVLSRLTQGIGGVYALAWSPDGKMLASASFDGFVRLSDPITGKVLKQFVPVPLKK